MAILYYQGHGSFRITTQKGKVIYVDPFAGDGYDLPADIVLVTHEHHDHNALSLLHIAPSCRVITEKEALAGGYQRFVVGDVEIQAVPAYNQNHDRSCCVGYLLTLDGISLYAAGDTSRTEEMGTLLSGKKLDYALLPTDGIYNMGPEEASDCARLIGAKHSIPIHVCPGALYDREKAALFQAEGRILLAPGESLNL